MQHTPSPLTYPRAGAVHRITASAVYETFADLLRVLADGAWWHVPVIRPGPLSVIVILSTVLFTVRTALILALLLQISSMALTLGSRSFRLRQLRRSARAVASRRSAEGGSVMTSWQRWTIPPDTRRQVERLREAHGDREIVIGRIDRRGRVLGLFGPLPGLPATAAAEFSPGGRFRVDIVLIGDHVLIRKDFQGDRIRFYAEWSTLVYLAGRVNVPAVHHVDVRRGIIYRDLVIGRTIRDLLVEAGAPILETATARDADLRALSPKMRKRAIEARATALLASCLPDRVVDEVERQILMIHDSRVTGVSHTFQNVVLEQSSGAPWFIDCENGRMHRTKSGWRFSMLREYERARFAQRYGRGPAAGEPGAAPLRADPETVHPQI